MLFMAITGVGSVRQSKLRGLKQKKDRTKITLRFLSFFNRCSPDNICTCFLL